MDIEGFTRSSGLIDHSGQDDPYGGTLLHNTVLLPARSFQENPLADSHLVTSAHVRETTNG